MRRWLEESRETVRNERELEDEVGGGDAVLSVRSGRRRRRMRKISDTDKLRKEGKR